MLLTESKPTIDEVEFLPADGEAEFDADFEEEFGDFSEERIKKVVCGSDCIGTSGFCNDCTC
jgi:hypothetical protein